MFFRVPSFYFFNTYLFISGYYWVLVVAHRIFIASCRSSILGHGLSLVVACRLHATWACSCNTWAWLLHSLWDLGSSIRDWTHIPCFERQILNHWTTREVPSVPSVLSKEFMQPGPTSRILHIVPFYWNGIFHYFCNVHIKMQRQGTEGRKKLNSLFVGFGNLAF